MKPDIGDKIFSILACTGIGSIFLVVGVGIAGWLAMTFNIDDYWINVIRELKK